MTSSDQLEVVSDFSAGAYLFLFNAREEIPRSKIEVPFVVRSIQKKKIRPSRVAPSVPCVARTGTTAEQPPGAVTAAERTERKPRGPRRPLFFRARPR